MGASIFSTLVASLRICSRCCLFATHKGAQRSSWGTTHHTHTKSCFDCNCFDFPAESLNHQSIDTQPCLQNRVLWNQRNIISAIPSRFVHILQIQPKQATIMKIHSNFRTFAATHFDPAQYISSPSYGVDRFMLDRIGTELVPKKPALLPLSDTNPIPSFRLTPTLVAKNSSSWKGPFVINMDAFQRVPTFAIPLDIPCSVGGKGRMHHFCLVATNVRARSPDRTPLYFLR